MCIKLRGIILNGNARKSIFYIFLLKIIFTSIQVVTYEILKHTIPQSSLQIDVSKRKTSLGIVSETRA